MVGEHALVDFWEFLKEVLDFLLFDVEVVVTVLDYGWVVEEVVFDAFGEEIALGEHEEVFLVDFSIVIDDFYLAMNLLEKLSDLVLAVG